MAKDKDKRGDGPSAALTRMNFLYQASHLVARSLGNNSLSNYYGKLMREVSKKVVEKVHPDLKRTLCAACNNSLVATNDQIAVKIKPHPRSKKKKRKKRNESSGVIGARTGPFDKGSPALCDTYTKSRLDRRNKRPNTINYCCSKCGYTKSYLQKPNYKIWVHRMDA